MGSVEDFTIRKIIKTDLPEIVSLAKECSLGFWSLRDYELELERTDSVCLSAVSSRRIVGFLVGRLIISSGTAELYNIAIGADSRRKGIGGRLVGEFARVAEKCRLAGILLDVRESNGGAVEFYQKLGFRLVGKRSGFYTAPDEAALLLRLSL